MIPMTNEVTKKKIIVNTTDSLSCFLFQTLNLSRDVELRTSYARSAFSGQQTRISWKELKKLDDENVLVEVQLLESKTYHALSNLPKAAKNRSLAEFQVWSTWWSKFNLTTFNFPGSSEDLQQENHGLLPSVPLTPRMSTLPSPPSRASASSS